MNRNKNTENKNEEMRYVPLNAEYPYQALRLIQAQMQITSEQMALVIHNYFHDDLDEF